jgi:uncharacterized protein YxeA
MRKKIIIAIILILLTIASGFWYIKGKQAEKSNILDGNKKTDNELVKQNEKYQTEGNNDTGLKNGIISESDNAGLKKYRNEYFHFEFEYPKEWEIREQTASFQPPYHSGEHYIYFTDPQSQNKEFIFQIFPMGGWGVGLEGQPKPKITKINLDGFDAKRNEVSLTSGNVLTTLELEENLPTNWNSYNIIVFFAEPNKKWIFERVLDSFQFF